MVTETINSSAYVLGITKSKVFSSLYKIFYHIISQNVTDTHSPARSKWWYPAFPDNLIDNKDSYPIIVINSPEVNWEKFTMHQKWNMCEIDIEAHVTKQSELDDLADQIVDAVESKYTTFRDIKIRMVNLDNTETNHVIRDQITIHSKVLTFTCQFSFTRSI
jgi:hypothetical protein